MIGDRIGDMRTDMETIRGDIRVIRAERPAREEISQIINLALEGCAARHRKASSDTIRKPENNDIILKIALGAVGVAGAALAIVNLVLG